MGDVMEKMVEAYDAVWQTWPGPIGIKELPDVKRAALRAALPLLVEEIVAVILDSRGWNELVIAKRVRSRFSEITDAPPTDPTYRPPREPWPALYMIREAMETLFGPIASLESSEAVLLRGPESIHEAEAIIEALGRVRDELDRRGGGA